MYGTHVGPIVLSVMYAYAYIILPNRIVNSNLHRHSHLRRAISGPPSCQTANRRRPAGRCSTRLCPAYEMRHGPLLPTCMVFANEKP